MIYAWAAAIIVFLIIEAVTTQLVTIWFALGSAAALVACALDISLPIQIVIFVAVTSVTLVATRPFIKKITQKKFSPTNADRCIGKTAKVVEKINNEEECGAVKINGVVWTARSLNSTQIEKDDFVTVKKIDGVKLIVEKE